MSVTLFRYPVSPSRFSEPDERLACILKLDFFGNDASLEVRPFLVYFPSFTIIDRCWMYLDSATIVRSIVRVKSEGLSLLFLLQGNVYIIVQGELLPVRFSALTSKRLCFH